MSGQLYAPAALPPGKKPPYTLHWRLGEPQSRSARGGEENKIATPSSSPKPCHYTYWATPAQKNLRNFLAM